MSQIFGFLKSIQKNNSQGNLGFEGFEYGHVFFRNGLNEIEEFESIAGIFGEGRIRQNWVQKPMVLDWFEAKGKVEHLFQKINLLTYWKSEKLEKEKQLFHSHRTAVIYVNGNKKLGYFGQIHPILARKLTLSPNLYLFEFNFELINNELKKNQLTIYQEYSLYPKIIKDLSFVINKHISFNYLQKILFLNSPHFLKTINLLDKYSGQNIPKNKISLCLQFVFQSDETTLQNKEIENILNHIKKELPV